jgi:tRNA pseudouridine38-40 synthase
VRRIKLTLEYDGTRYGGWQRQHNAPSIQQEVETALARVVQENIHLVAAGRTDAGVHALGQVAHFETNSSLSLSQIQRGTNRYLPEDIVIRRADDVPSHFHARYSAVQRWYRYHIMNGRERPVLYRNYYAFVPYRLDMQLVKDGCALLSGEHDFAGFRSQQCTARRTRLALKVEMHHDEDILLFDFTCRSFLHNMVRILVGVLVELGRGSYSLKDISVMFDRKKRPARIPTMPPQGLVLMRVDYAD